MVKVENPVNNTRILTSVLLVMEGKRLSAWQGLEDCVEKGLVRYY